MESGIKADDDGDMHHHWTCPAVAESSKEGKKPMCTQLFDIKKTLAAESMVSQTVKQQSCDAVKFSLASMRC